MDLVQGAVGRGRWRQSSLGGPPAAPWLGLVEKPALFGIAKLWEAQRALHQSAGDCKGPSAAFTAHSLSLNTSWTEPKAKPAPPGWHPRVSPALQISALVPPPTGYSYPPGQLQTPQNAFPSGWQRVQNKCGHSKKNIHVFLNPISRRNSSAPSNSLSLAARAIPKGWVTGRRKGFFTANPEWERSKEGVQAVRFEWHVDNGQESRQGTLPPSLTPTVRRLCSNSALHLVHALP